MDRSTYEIRRDALNDAVTAAEATVADTRMVRADARETRERVALNTRIRREFMSLPEEVRKDRLRRRTYYSPLDAPFLL